MSYVVILSGSKMYWFSGVPTRDKPAYNCPWEKHSFLKSREGK